MVNTFNNIVKGYLRIRVYSNYQEKFLNRVMFKRINLWHIKKKEDYIEANIRLDDFFRIRKMIRNTKSKVSIVRKIGFPFIISKVKRKKMFLLGILLFYFGLVILSSMIWSVEVIGTSRLNKQEVLKQLEVNEIKIGGSKIFLDLDDIEKKMYEHFKDIIWISIDLKGTSVKVNLVESTNKSKEIPSNIPCDIIADKNAVIYETVTSKGTPIVKEKDVVKKGDLLVSGTIDVDKDGQIVKKYVHAQAKVLGKSYIYIYCEQDLKLRRKKYTGEKYKDIKLKILGHEFDVTKKKDKYKNYDLIEKEESLNPITDSLRFRINTKEYKEYVVVEKKLNVNEAKTTIMNKVNKYLQKDVPKETLIKEITPNYYVKGNKLVADVIVSVVGEIGSKKVIENYEE